VEEMNFEEFNDEYDVIFRGEVIGIKKALLDVPYYVWIKVEKLYKGNFIGDSVLTIWEDGSTCDYGFIENKSFLVFAYIHQGRLQTDRCTRTQIEYTWQNVSQIENKTLDFLNSFSPADADKATYRFSNGQRMAKGKYKNGLPFGKWTYYYPNGKVKAEGKYIGGKRDGLWLERAGIYKKTRVQDSLKFVTYKNGISIHST